MARISQSSLIKLDYFHQCLKTIDGVLAKDRSQNIWEFFLKISETLWELTKIYWNICKYLKVFENICKLITLDQGQSLCHASFSPPPFSFLMTKGLKILGASTTDKYHEVILELTPSFNSTLKRKIGPKEGQERQEKQRQWIKETGEKGGQRW